MWVIHHVIFSPRHMSKILVVRKKGRMDYHQKYLAQSLCFSLAIL